MSHAITREQAAALADVICDTALLNTTLRDLFAAFALAGLMGDGLRGEAVAKIAYQYADAMLAQRTALAEKES